MSIKKLLNALFREIAQEANANPAFRARLEAVLVPGSKSRTTKPRDQAREPHTPQPKRPSNRRPPALIDPVHLAREGEDVLRAELAKLDLEQLRDVVADYGMDPGKLVLKWRDAERVIERIVEVARGRAQKGSAFREQSDLIDRPATANDGTDEMRAVPSARRLVMQKGPIKSNGDRVLVDVEIDGKERRVSITREAIWEYLRLPPKAAASMTLAERQEFVRTHLPEVIAAAKRKLGVTNASADLVMINAGEL